MRVWGRIRAFGAVPLIVAGLMACAPLTSPPPVAAPAPRAAAAQGGMPTLPAAIGPASAESLSATRYYARVQNQQQSTGLMRTDGDAIDVPVTAAMLARNFETIALFNEYVQVDGRFIARQSAAQLRRWQAPVRVKLHFGPSVPPVVRSRDTTVVAWYLTRLSRVTGHPITLETNADRANYHIFVVNMDEQRRLGPLLRAAEPGLSDATINEIATLPRNNYCAVYASSTQAAPFTYTSAIALVRAEHPQLMRDACYHEEIAQGLGLANDSPNARPSIFNDDEEFALLTSHDELLLGMLYDPRLRPGMTADAARPIIARMARERAPDGDI